MTFKKLSSILAVTFLSIAGFSAQAQLRLPASHANQHSSLIANQKPSTNPFKLENNNILLNDLKEREAQFDEEIFGQFWNSERVNPYGTAVTVPDHHDIDVSEYTTPCPGHITSNYGYRSRFGRMHYGIDLKLQVGDTVRAAFSGKVFTDTSAASSLSPTSILRLAILSPSVVTPDAAQAHTSISKPVILAYLSTRLPSSTSRIKCPTRMYLHLTNVLTANHKNILPLRDIQRNTLKNVVLPAKQLSVKQQLKNNNT